VALRSNPGLVSMGSVHIGRKQMVMQSRDRPAMVAIVQRSGRATVDRARPVRVRLVTPDGRAVPISSVPVAQRTERRTATPGVRGSIPLRHALPRWCNGSTADPFAHESVGCAASPDARGRAMARRRGRMPRAARLEYEVSAWRKGRSDGSLSLARAARVHVPAAIRRSPGTLPADALAAPESERSGVPTARPDDIKRCADAP
jgi:hypothetical protein